MINSKKRFERLNGDDSAIALAETDVLNAENVLFSSDEFGKNFELKGVPSTQLLFYYSSGLNTLGTSQDYNRLRVLFFDHRFNSEDTIYAYDIQGQNTYTVLKNIQTLSGFNFSNSFRISRNAKVVDDLLVWTDANNEPMCISIEAGIKLNQPSYVTEVEPYATGIPYETLTLIKRPPIFRPQVAKIFDGGFDNNYIENNAYQFTIRYQYKNNQYSCLSAFSQLMPYNGSGSLFNYINVAMSFSEQIPDYVQQVDLIVRYGNFGKSFIIRSYNKAYPYDLFSIEAHNAGSIQLGFAFYDNVAGIALDDITANTSFHLVPLATFTLEVAKNRLFLGNNISGYDTPQKTSLSATLTTTDTGAAGSYAGTWWFATLHANTSCQDEFMFPYIYSATAPSPYYYASSVRNSTIWNGGVGSVPATINLSDCVGFASVADMIDYLKHTQYPFLAGGCTLGNPVWTEPYETTDMSISVSIINYESESVNQFFKSNSTYYVSIAFYDRFRRKCGINRNYTTMVIPQRTYDQTIFNAAIQWTLQNTYAIEEIPEWAYYYQIHITRNTTTRFFEQIAVNDSTYVTRDQDGTYTYGISTFDPADYAIGFDLSLLTGVGMGYTFTEGDFAVVYLDATTNYTLRVIGQDGNFVLLEPKDIGTLDNTTLAIIELYTPYRPNLTEPFYETGEVMSISDPGTDVRAYTVLSGTINGDCYAIERELPDTTLYIVEAMSPNDSVWFIWQTDTGWVNFIDSIGQTIKETEITWSDTFLDDTKTNALNVFQPLNRKNVGSSSGSIQKLQLTNKMSESGTVMLVITETDNLSAYLSEVQLYRAATVDGLITTDEVIGSINALQNSQGTINPESVVEYNGTVWWISVVKGTVAQYDNNGVSTISDIKMRRFFDRFGKRYVELGKTAIEALCGFSHIAGCIDLTNGLYMVTLPQTEEAINVDVLFGLNGVMAFSARSFSNTDVQNAIAALGQIDIMRYPGGNVANSFNWHTGKDDDNSGEANTLDDIAALYNSEGCDILFVLNMITHDLTDQLAMLAAADALGIPIKYVELGNEFNNINNPGHTTFPLPADYADEAEIWTDAIKAIYPDCMVAWIGGNRNWEGGDVWNSTMLAKNKADALTWHESPNIDTFWNGSVVDYAAISTGINIDWLDEGMDLVTSVPVWATEFNYTYEDDNILPDDVAQAVTLFIMQQIPLYIGNSMGLKIMCVRGVEGTKQGAIYVTNTSITLMPTGFAVMEYLSSTSTESFAANSLPSYSSIPSYTTSIQNRFDVYDGNAKTMCFNFNKNVWVAPFLWTPEIMEYLGNKLYGFKEGRMWLHNENSSSFNVIYGVQYPQRVCLAINDISPSAIKDLYDLAIEANAKPNFTVGYSDYPFIQITDLTADDFTTKQGIQLARWFRDRLSPNTNGTSDEKLFKGDIVQSTTPLLMIEWSEFSRQLICKFVNCGFEIARGLTQTDFIKPTKTN